MPLHLPLHKFLDKFSKNIGYFDPFSTKILDVLASLLQNFLIF
jgi:hypothetical protein